MIRSFLSRWLGALALAATLSVVTPATASAQASTQYSFDQLVTAGNSFFGQVSGNLASVVEEAVSRFGLPNGYILGEMYSGALVAGIRFGDGTLYTQNLGTYPIYWRGPTIGFDIGADASQTMMLVYGLPSVDAMFGMFPGVNGSAFVVGGVGMTVLSWNGITIVPIVSGLGARIGVSVGYLRFADGPF